MDSHEDKKTCRKITKRNIFIILRKCEIKEIQLLQMRKILKWPLLTKSCNTVVSIPNNYWAFPCGRRKIVCAQKRKQPLQDRNWTLSDFAHAMSLPITVYKYQAFLLMWAPVWTKDSHRKQNTLHRDGVINKVAIQWWNKLVNIYPHGVCLQCLGGKQWGGSHSSGVT